MVFPDIESGAGRKPMKNMAQGKSYTENNRVLVARSGRAASISI